MSLLVSIGDRSRRLDSLQNPSHALADTSDPEALKPLLSVLCPAQLGLLPPDRVGGLLNLCRHQLLDRLFQLGLESLGVVRSPSELRCLQIRQGFELPA